MFKIGKEVMDINGNCYTVMGIGHATYDLLDSEGNMQHGVLDVWIAKYLPNIAENLTLIAENIHQIEVALNESRNIQRGIFESVRRA